MDRNKQIRNLIMGIMICFALVQVQAQDNVKVLASDVVPAVFLIGQNQESYAALHNDYPSSLLEVKGEDLSEAYTAWVRVLDNMESYAEQVDFNLKGVKLWMHIYWAADGQIKHISYFLKPNSRNKSPEDLKAFFSLFMEQFSMPEVAMQNYNHYGSASFPVLSE